MFLSWEKRPEITAHLINPAFCSEILRRCVYGFKEEANKNFPYILSFLILPLILNSRIRDRLPKTKSTTLHAWINKNDDLRIGLAEYIKSYVPFSKESLMFAIVYDSLSIDENGNIDLRTRHSKFNTQDAEVKNCLKKAEVIGKILSKSGNSITIYSILGIKP